ncbi:MAG: peptide transporter ATP-binding protein [Actinomycetia bacterium]|nr:peptide transporter ATP-binding protein [Actinomycetes bacterium]
MTAVDDAVVRADDLTVTFRRGGRDIHALRGVSLEVRPGEILGLVGESGSGKSVLGMSLLGLLAGEPVTTGRAVVCGEDMLVAPAEVRRRIRRDHLGAVFQDPMTSLNPTMKVGAQVAEAAGSGAEAERLLRAVGVPDPGRRMSSFPHELSGGLRQRVMIAMAVAGRPSLVIADEPTTALDVTVQAQVLDLLRSLRDEIGCSFLLITHDLGVAAQVADRVAVMYAGRLAECGPTPSVLRAAAHPYSLGLMTSRLTLESPRHSRLPTLAGEVPSPAAPPPGCAFEPRCALSTSACTEVLPDPEPVAPDHLSACLLPMAEVRERLLVDPPRAEAAPGVPVPSGGENTKEGTEAPAVVVRRADKTFRVQTGRGWGRARLQALRDVDLTVAAGESVAIVGESGSGKSTLLRLIAGLERVTHGDVTLGGAVGAQMVFQDAGSSLTPWLTVGELIGERLRGRGMSREQRSEEVRRALTQVGLPAEVAGARAGQLSGGQRQRVVLARATVIPPEVLLCDEPTSALDVSLAAGVINLIARLRQDLRMAVVFVTHDLSVARIVADRIAVMYLGRIVEQGPAEDVVGRPRHPYTKALVAAIPDFEVRPIALAGEPASPLRPPSGCSFHPRCPIALPVCSDSDLDPRLIGIGGGADRMVACIHPEVN